MIYGAALRKFQGSGNGYDNRHSMSNALDTHHSFLESHGEMAKRFSQFPWEKHPLGPLEQWPSSLKTAVSLILNSRHPMWIGWGRQMSFLYNDAYLHVLGLAKHPWALGRPADEVWAEIWDVCGPLADKVFRFGEASFVDDVRLMMSRGNYLEETFYSFSYSPIRDESGEVAGLFCPSNDVTAKVVGARRSRTLSELVANALVQKSTAAAGASALATLAKNPDDVPFALLYLVDGDRCILQHAVGVESDPASGIAQAISDVVRSGRAEEVSLRSLDALPRSPEGQPIAAAMVMPMAGLAQTQPLGAFVAGINPSRPLDDEYRAFFELVASNIATAIQNAHAAEEERKRIDVLAEMDRAKTAFFSNVSHEFRTPLTLMLGPLEQLSRIDDERGRALASTARRNALRLLKLVNTLLEFSRLEAGRNDASFVVTDLAALTRDVASSFRSAIESAGLRFVVEADLDEPVFVDRSMWERILLNLLSNALKFTFEGEIGVTLRRAGDAAELSVRDTGAGIAPDDLTQIFERFHRVRGAKSRSHEGSGIGLALVRDLTELHGGSVGVESAVGEGTTFRVCVPLGSAHLDQAKVVSGEITSYASSVEQYLADIEATVTRANTTFTVARGPGGTRPRVLLADDNADLRDYVGGILAGRYEVTTVANGRDALAAARAGTFDLIVSDVMMPEMDGFEFLRAVREDERIATTPFIILSARAGEAASLDGLIAGADDYVVKPFSADELLARVYVQINAASIRARAAREREFLARASEILAQPLDLDATLAAIASFTVPEVADWCQIDLRTDDGRIRTVATAHRDAAKDALAKQFVGRIHLDPQGEHGVAYVMRTGTSQLFPVVPKEILEPAINNAEEARVYEELGIHSALAVPLSAEGETLGVLGVVYGSSLREYSNDDLLMLEELGRRAGLAIHKARRFEREHRVAELFQEASLPAHLPDVPGLTLDAFYAPGRIEAQVGGDWYDALRLADGRVVVSIGDVAGSGVQAAVTMGNMRQIIRGIAQVHADPALMLDAADRALRLEYPDKFVTAFVGVFDPIASTFTYASAGQPPPLLRGPDGTVEALAETGLPLGLRANAGNAGSTTIDLLPGSHLLLYTDGLTEFDHSPLSGESRLREILANTATWGDRPAKSIVESVMNDAGARDDVAALFLTITAPAERDARGRDLLSRWSFATSDGDAAAASRHAFAQAYAERGATLDDVMFAEMVFGELVSNTVRYAPGWVEVVADWSGPDPVLHVIDRGPGFRHISILPPDLLSESGRGLFIVSALTHDFYVSKRATGGSHARAVLRTGSRQLVDRSMDLFARTPLLAFGDPMG